MEHAVANKPDKESLSLTNVGSNASTDPYDMRVKVWGVADSRHPEFGALPIINIALDQISKPPEIPEDFFDTERGVILAELAEKYAKPNYITYEGINEIIYDKLHPDRYLTLGSEADISSLTKEEVMSQHGVVFIPMGSTVTVLTEGTEETTSLILDKTEEAFSAMPGAGLEPKVVDEKLEGLINTDFEQGRTYIKDLGLGDGIITMQYVWVTPDSIYSEDSFVDSRMIGLAGNKLYKVVRRGYGYGKHTGGETERLGDEKKLMKLTFRVPKNKIQEGFKDDYSDNNAPISKEKHDANLEKFARDFYNEHVKNGVLGSLEENDLTYLKNLSIQAEVVPTIVYDRLDWALYGLSKYGQVIDSDKLTDIEKAITPDDIKRSMQALKSRDPAILIVGDVNLPPYKPEVASK